MRQLKQFRKIALATLLACSASVANAAAIKLDDSSTLGIDVTVYDGGVEDANPLAGGITYIGAVGTWLYNVTTGFTIPLLPIENPMLHLDSVNISSSRGGTLHIWFSENNFVGSTGYIASIVSSLGGLTTGTVTLNTYLDSSNALFGTGTALNNLSFTGGAGSDADATYMEPPTGPYSLTAHATITHTGFSISSLNGELKVPEPGTLSLMGAMLVAAGFVGRRRQSAMNRAA